MTRVAAYCRVSTDKDDQLHSFESQRFFFREYIRCRPGWTLTEIYADEGITGTSTSKRDGFNRLIRDALDGLFDLVLTKEVSRFSRNILDAVAYTRLLKSRGIGVIFLNDGISTLEPDAELRLSIMASVAQEESRKTSERVKWGQQRRMEQGVVFGRSLLGYTVSGGRITVEPEGAAVVRMIFTMFTVQRMGTRAIAERLTAMGLETMSGRAVWSPASVLKIIKNEKYCGDLLQRKTVTPDYLTHKKTVNRDGSSMILIRDHHEPIVSRALWDAAQAERRRRAASAGPQGGHGSRYALSGKIACAACAAPFVCRTKKRREGPTYRVWQSTCKHGVRQLREDWIVRCVREIAASCPEQAAPAQAPVITASMNTEDGSLLPLLTALRQLEEKRLRLTEKYVSGDITRPDYLALRERCRKQGAALALRLVRAVPPSGRETAAERDNDDDFYLRAVVKIKAGDHGGVTIHMGNLPEGRTFIYKSPRRY